MKYLHNTEQWLQRFSYIINVDGHMNEPPEECRSRFTGSVVAAVLERSVLPSSSVAS